MDGFKPQEIDTEVEELFHAVIENFKSEEKNTVDTKPAISSKNYECQRPDDGTEDSRAIPLLLHCRLCGVPHHNMVDIFDSNATSKNILSKISLCLPVTVKETDTLPKQVCWSCLEELDRCYRFHQTVAKAEKQLLAFDRLVSINLEKRDRNNKTSAQCDGQHKGPEHDFDGTLKTASGIEPSNISTRSSERAQTAKTSGKTNDQILRLEPCWVALSTVGTPCQNRIHATSETTSLNDSQLRNTEEFDIGTTENSGTAIRIVQQSTCDSEVSQNSGSKSAAKATQGKETKHKIGPAIHKRSRTQERHYRCATCAKEYKNRGSLTKHYRLHTGEGLYICKYCGLKCLTKLDAIRHNRTHTGQRSFKCSMCKKRLTRLPNLESHKATVHSDRKDYPCPLCDKSFKALRYRKNHMLLHTDESQRRLWQCDHCKRNFMRRHHLVRHVKSCEGQYRSNNVISM